jgi:hypothetical protein
MQMRNLTLVFLYIFFAGSSVSASRLSSDTDGINALAGLTYGGIRGLSDMVCKGYDSLVTDHPYIALSILGFFALSLVQKESPEFFNTGVRLVESPFLLIQKKLQKSFCGGQSLTWNEVASWHNRISRLLTPLTKTTSMVDLSKDRRLRIMDQEDGQDEGQDDQWKQQVRHIERECGFMIKMLTLRLAFYKEQSSLKKKKINPITRVIKAPVNVVQAMGRSVLRASLTRNEEVAFGLEEAVSYLQETITYCKSISHFSGLDKEHMKRLMGNICTTFEHIGVLVDELSAADKNKKKLPMTADGTLTRGGYAGGSYGGYDSPGGSYG